MGPLGFGANGPAWLARSATGGDVVVSVLPLPAGPAGRSRLRRLAALRHSTHPHLARVQQVVAMGDGRCAVISDRVRGPTLDTVVRAREALTEPELYGLLHALAGALAHLHGRGVIHGDVSPSNIVLDDDGAPVLVDLAGEVTHELGTEGFVAPERHRGAPATPAGDVWALARVVQWAAGPAPARSLIDRLGEALRSAPERRPTARELKEIATAAGERRPLSLPSAAVLAQARMRAPEAVTRRRPAGRREAAAAMDRRDPSPVRRPAPVPPGPGSSVRHAASGPQARRTRRRHLLGTVVVAVGLTVGATVVGPWLRPADEGLDAAGAVVVLDDLLTRRDGALMAQDARALAGLSVPGSDFARRDAELLAALRTSDTRVMDLVTTVPEVQEVADVDDGTAVDAVVVQGPHVRVRDGVREEVPALAPVCSRMIVVPTEDAGWRLLRTAPCD